MMKITKKVSSKSAQKVRKNHVYFILSRILFCPGTHRVKKKRAMPEKIASPVGEVNKNADIAFLS